MHRLVSGARPVSPRFVELFAFLKRLDLWPEPSLASSCIICCVACVSGGETVVAYQSRFDALITDIPTITEGARLFVFRSALSEVLAAACVVAQPSEETLCVVR